MPPATSPGLAVVTGASAGIGAALARDPPRSVIRRSSARAHWPEEKR